MTILRGTIRHKVNVAVLLIDMYSEAVIHNGVIVSAFSGLVKPVKKPDGYFVFTDCPGDSIELYVKSEKYNEYRTSILLSELNPLKPIVKIFLTPVKRYLPESTTSVTIEAKPFERVRLIYETDANVYKLLGDIAKSTDKISVYNPSQRDLEGVEFVLMYKKGDFAESFKISEKLTEDFQYSVNAAFAKTYKQMDVLLIRAITLIAEADGKIFYPVLHFDGQNKKLLLMDEKDKLKTIALVPNENITVKR